MIIAGLRPVDASDRERLLAWRNSPQVAAFMYSDHLITREEHDRWFDGLAENPRRRDWIILLEGAPVGLTSLVDIDPVQGRGTIARYIAEESARGQGVGGFAEFKIADHAFGPLGLRKLWSEVLATNQAALASHLSSGFQREALLRAHVVKRGQPTDVIGLGLLAEAWRDERPSLRRRLLAKGFSEIALETPL
ncbi:UDP-4-amino-4,6-dideoxy-N-acetyl-beta-L-altrosamine N-acetyltransferase [Caulobacter segnis]|uniref:UDP-4-amino-4, 6-dideoxy-N-acetyl-beta-L-altrosamine N-acetyltransferase n=1 Tax=Caulobacter segnis TaxID=88688 RepID=UPI00285E1BCE|nr:UDP-4-amino-4,6-dideoxy-N-acetyl-beta-L-altrosamine N-acetyltransferase [Caulobacter segnis]MDR6625722.1 UDP-4-amino-4,6-dideoxy-N-acetyl-beta-L-altrosamine N-acetyltransferase [Caulobacter segnis]